MRKRCFWAAFGFIVYLILLRVLVYAESFSGDTAITTMSEAVWFSLVTLTTVGYGDYFPVTVVGRIIGAFFLLSSTGLIALLIGMVISAAGKLLPWLRLYTVRKRPWYVFAGQNRESAALAANLLREQPDAAVIFCCRGGEAAGLDRLPSGLRCYRVDGRPEDVLLRRWRGENCTFLMMGRDGCDNYMQAQRVAEAGGPVCCQSDFAPDRMPGNLTIFDRWDCCARLYWQQYPLAAEEHSVVLAGCGRYGAALLERALLCNVYGPERAVTYYVFGDSGDFLRCHPQLGEILRVEVGPAARPGEEVCAGQGNGRQDRLVFCEGAWDSVPGLLEQADRIILCEDSEEENLNMLRRIRLYFPTEGRLQLRLDGKLEGEDVFGTEEEIFTPELVLRTRLNRLAMEMHEIYRRSGGAGVEWNQLGDFLRRSNLAAADHLPAKIRILLADDTITEITPENCRAAYSRYLENRVQKAGFYREIEHIRWMRFYAMYNWKYGETRDNERRLHPDMRPFGQLTAAEQAKDDYAWELLVTLAMEPAPGIQQ